jgi:DNA-binding HxlR family transcriptional regulator
MTTVTSGRAGCKAIVADKWSLRLVAGLGAGPRRFTELKRGTPGISQRMLTVSLRSLERDGILIRTVHNVMPPNISYELTPMGRELLAAASPLMRWSAGNLALIEAARAEYDGRQAEEDSTRLRPERLAR